MDITVFNNEYEKVKNITVEKSQSSFISDYDRLMLQLKQPHSEMYLLWVDAEVVGYCLVRENPEYNNCFIWQLAISSTYQKRGLGHQFLKELISIIKKKDISHFVTTISKGNLASMRLFQKLGFTFENDELDDSGNVFESHYILKIQT